MLIDQRTAFAALAALSCACGKLKNRGHAFCHGCEERLPREIIGRLYKAEDFAANYQEATDRLGLTVRITFRTLGAPWAAFAEGSVAGMRDIMGGTDNG